MSEVEHTMYDPFLGEWVPFEPNRAFQISLIACELRTHQALTREEIIEKFGDELTEEQLKLLKENQS